MKLVWRHRNAGVCSTSTTSATSAIGVSSCTSVSTGTPICSLTFARISSPSSMPGPRKLARDERLALSKEALKMNGMPSSARDLAHPPGHVDHERLALDDAGTRDQEQRPVDRRPRSPQSFMRPRPPAAARRGSSRAALDEAREQRMPVARRGAELGVVLACDEQRMARQLDDLDQPVAREAGKPQARVHHLLQVAVVELVAMPVALADHVRAVDRVRERAVRDADLLRAEPHRAAEIRAFVARLERALLVLPLGDQRDDRVRAWRG